MSETAQEEMSLKSVNQVETMALEAAGLEQTLELIFPRDSNLDKKNLTLTLKSL